MKGARGCIVARLGLLGLVGLAGLLGPSRARAQARAPSIEFAPSCDGVVVGLDSALRVELVDRAAELDEALRTHTFVISLECSDEEITVRASDAATRRFVGQRVERAERGLPRQLAVVAAELLSALASQLAAAPRPAAPPMEAAPPTASAPEDPTGPSVGIRVAGSVRGVGTPLSALYGGALGVELGLAPFARLAIDVGAGHAEVGSARGTIDVTSLSLDLSLRLGGAIGSLWLGAGALVRGGAVFYGGRPASSSGITGREAILPSLALGAVLTMAVAIEGTPVSIELDLEGGGVALSPIALVDGVPGFDLGPAFFGAQLGLLFRVG